MVKYIIYQINRDDDWDIVDKYQVAALSNIDKYTLESILDVFKRTASSYTTYELVTREG